ncbi:hypothetical protein OAB47_03315 [Vicingaceae bacterium]|nr:hypothetical protein [Vicingaceae bacterium]
MKKLHWILSLTTISLLSACTSSYQSSTTLSRFDDIYYSPTDIPRIPAPSAAETEAIANDGYTDDYALEEPLPLDENTVNRNNQDFNMDDYYDYEYTARLRRFHGPTVGVGMGMGYYDPFFVDPFFYNRNPMFIGGSIYDPFFSPMGGWNVGFGYNPWGWNNGFGMNNAYWAGYNHGFNNGFYGGNGFDNGFGRSVSRSNTHYAPRGSGITAPYQRGGRAEQNPIRENNGRMGNPTNNTTQPVRPETRTARPATRPSADDYARPSSPTASPTTRPTTRPNVNQSVPQNVRPQVPSNATAVPQQSTRPSRTNTYSRPSRGGSYNQPTTPQRSSPTRTAPQSSSPSRSPSFNSSPSFNRSSGGGSRSSSPRSSSPR